MPEQWRNWRRVMMGEARQQSLRIARPVSHGVAGRGSRVAGLRPRATLPTLLIRVHPCAVDNRLRRRCPLTHGRATPMRADNLLRRRGVARQHGRAPQVKGDGGTAPVHCAADGRRWHGSAAYGQKVAASSFREARSARQPWGGRRGPVLTLINITLLSEAKVYTFLGVDNDESIPAPLRRPPAASRVAFAASLLDLF